MRQSVYHLLLRENCLTFWPSIAWSQIWRMLYLERRRTL
jgi:hypothetical protein